ncbi:hypothetical protein [Mycolicibacterium sp.]|uniref:hypothetical protein n=1 Tax=Mycolicibacterium sp. TaxID=2320850 RepID=UPI0037C53C90
MKRALLGAALTAAALCTTSCDNQREAESVDRQIAGLPGVSSTALSYTSNISSGESFRLTVNLMPDVTESQVVQIGRTFVDQSRRADLDDESAQLSLVFSSPDPPPKYPGIEENSTASFAFGKRSVRFNPTAEQVGDSAAV